jgi:hypothetical protein
MGSKLMYEKTAVQALTQRVKTSCAVLHSSAAHSSRLAP